MCGCLGRGSTTSALPHLSSQQRGYHGRALGRTGSVPEGRHAPAGTWSRQTARAGGRRRRWPACAAARPALVMTGLRRCRPRRRPRSRSGCKTAVTGFRGGSRGHSSLLKFETCPDILFFPPPPCARPASLLPLHIPSTVHVLNHRVTQAPSLGEGLCHGQGPGVYLEKARESSEGPAAPLALGCAGRGRRIAAAAASSPSSAAWAGAQQGLC